jgi:hypothetical protein
MFFKMIAYVLVLLGLEILFLVIKSRALTTIGVLAMVLPIPLIPVLFKWYTKAVTIELNREECPPQYSFS